MRNFLIISVIGPDGSGKSLLIDYLIKKFKKKKINTIKIHLKPAIFKKKKHIVKNPHNRIPRSSIFSNFKLFYWLLIFWIYFLFNFKKKKKIFFFDRYPHDILIDPLRYRIKFPNTFLQKILDFFPKPNYWIFMTGEPKKVWLRKKEIEFKVLKKQINKYAELKKTFRNSISISKKQEFYNIFQLILKKFNKIKI